MRQRGRRCGGCVLSVVGLHIFRKVVPREPHQTLVRNVRVDHRVPLGVEIRAAGVHERACGQRLSPVSKTSLPSIF
eukprot:8725231-Pyramimonas_sp.AAC.3